MDRPRRLGPIIAAFAIAILIAGVTAQRIFSGIVEVPEVRFPTTTGQVVATSDLRGQVLLINFWATSCVPCVKEMPALAETWRRHQPKGFETIAVAMEYDPPNLVMDFTRRFALPFRVALDPRGEIAQRFGQVKVVPTTFLVDRSGRVILKREGELDFGALEPLIVKALAEAA